MIDFLSIGAKKVKLTYFDMQFIKEVVLWGKMKEDGFTRLTSNAGQRKKDDKYCYR